MSAYLPGETFCVATREVWAAVGGWFARNAEVLRQVGDVLLDAASRQEQPLRRWLTAADAFEQCDKATGQAIYEARPSPAVLMIQSLDLFCHKCNQHQVNKATCLVTVPIVATVGLVPVLSGMWLRVVSCASSW